VMQPPWSAFPTMPLGSVGWRMGEGEGYWRKFDEWYRRLQPAHRERYAVEHPEPEGWAGFYLRKDAYLESLGNRR
jgi:hypothetical protein